MEYQSNYLNQVKPMQCPYCRGMEFHVYSIEMHRHSYNSEKKEWGDSEPVGWLGEYNDSVVCRNCGKEIAEQFWEFG